MTDTPDAPDQGRVHRCPVTLPAGEQCPATIGVGYLMDARHWHMVPRPLQRAVYRTWQRGLVLARPDQLPAYLAARQAAIDAVDAQLRQAASEPVRHRH